jgi:hypothetical protein
MAEADRISFTYKEVVEALLKTQSVHDGIWGLYVEFALAASNVGPSDEELKPAAIIPIIKIGIQRFEKENNLSFDASKVNPKRVK